MLWFLIALAFLILAIKFRWARYVLLAFVVVVVVTIGYFWQQDESRKREYEASKTRVPISDVQFEDLRLQPTYGSGHYRLSGRIQNTSSKYNLLGAKLQFTMQDCVGKGDVFDQITPATDSKRECETVGQAECELSTLVPPSQVRGIDEYVWFSSLPAARGAYEWEYRVIYVRAAP
jgi:hypothetical protein